LKSRIHQESFLVLSEGLATPSTTLPQIAHGMRGGHPSLHPDGKWIVSDTLPDSKGERQLFLASLDGGQLIPLLSVAHDPASANSPYRCDSHPRWDRSGRAVSIDSLHEGFRGLYTVDVSRILSARVPGEC
jgi:Tol biopolymer transport system component